ncbi:SPOR domain-containing protein [Thermoactinomyces mirandus]|uniref:SPOR domain-containing protein n=1 Tax=Thermoactinomyces mirandus TaxID=2756294 RepID=A0A7W1XSZ8_9BACL|nr:SPOR domain-containing protein [Thermoactinomyces mirandus]MBA4602714.1 SPOR domain-containing protein [Thermoactinomyces mirandus]
MDNHKRSRTHVHKTGLKVNIRTKKAKAKARNEEKKSDCSVVVASEPPFRPGPIERTIGKIPWKPWPGEKVTRKISWEQRLEEAKLDSWDRWMEGQKKKSRVVEWASPNNPFKHKKTRSKKDTSRIWQIILSAVAALIIGTVMGFSVLNLFFAENSTHSSRSIDDHLQLPSPATEKRNQVHETTVLTQTLPPLQAVVLQAGNFSEKAGAEKTVKQYRVKGLAAVMSEQAPYRIYLGLAPDRDLALKLSAIYHKLNVSVYLKDVHLNGETSLKTEVYNPLNQALKLGNQLFRKLSTGSAQAIGASTSDKALPFEMTEELSREYQQFVVQTQSVKNQLPSEAGQALDRMIQSMDQAVQSGTAGRKNPNQALLWQMQEGLARYVAAYEQLLQTLKKQ